MKRTALYPGSFDPFTLGHKTIVIKALALFDNIVIAIGDNSAKNSFLTIEKRIALINKVFTNDKRVSVVSYKGLTASYCNDNNIDFIIRGLRSYADYEFERNIAEVNRHLNPSLETILLMTPAEQSKISSTIVREILAFGGDPMAFMPEELTIDDLR